MVKSKILKELVNNDIAMDVALKRLILFANELNDDELKKWAENELTGYKNENELPPYRIIKSTVLKYSGLNGTFNITSLPLPRGALSSETYDAIRNCPVPESISNVEKKANQSSELALDRTYLAGEVASRTRQGFLNIKCTEIEQLFQPSQFSEIVSSVSFLLLKVFMTLDKEFGNLDDLDIDTSDVAKVAAVKEQINVIIFQDNSVSIGDNNKIEKSDVVTGDKNGN